MYILEDIFQMVFLAKKILINATKGDLTNNLDGLRLKCSTSLKLSVEITPFGEMTARLLPTTQFISS